MSHGFRLISFSRGLLAFGLASSVGGAQSAPRMVRTCDVFSAPTTASARVCRRRPGEVVSAVERATPGFLKVRVAGCEGYVFDACLGSATVSSGRRGAGRSVASASPSQSYRLGLTAGLDGNFGKVAYSSSLSSGMGYALGVRFDIPLGSSLRISLSGGYRALKLSRRIDGSGSINDPNPAEYAQVMPSLSAQAVLGWVALADSGADLLVEVGTDFVKPFSASQTDASGTVTTFAATDKMLMLLGGIGLDYPFNPDLALLGQLHSFYNVGAASGSGLFGVRLAITLSLTL